MFGKITLLVFVHHFLLVQSVNLKIFKQLSLIENSTHEICKSYNKYFEKSKFIRVFKVLTKNDNGYNEDIDNYTDKLTKCFIRSWITFSNDNIHIKQTNLLPTDFQDFDIITNDTAKLRKPLEIWQTRKTVSRMQKGIVIVSETPEQLLSYFKQNKQFCWRCLHLLVFTRAEFEENEIYNLLKKFWNEANILNIIVHGVRTRSKYYWYSYNPFYLRYVNTLLRTHIVI